MKKIRILALATSLSILSVAVYAVEVTTGAVGFIKTRINANSIVAIGPGALSKNPIDVGALTSVTATTLGNTAASWQTSPADLSDPANPHLIKMVSGASNGRFFLIDSNTDKVLTFSTLDTPDLTTLVAVGDKYQIIPAWTLGKLLGTTSIAPLTVADRVYIRKPSGWDTYLWNGSTNWRFPGGPNISKNDVIIYPDEGLLIENKEASPAYKEITMTGVCPTTNEKNEVGPNGTFVANRFPTDTTLLALGLHTIPGWSSTDQVLVKKAAGWDTYIWNGTNWRLPGGPNIDKGTTNMITAGTAYLVLRGSTNATVQVSQTLPY